MFSPTEIIIILLIGSSAGIMVGIMGGSGVMVVVPMLTLILSFPIHTAIGTSLLIDVIATIVTSFVYYRHQHLHVKPGLWIALGSVIGAQLGSLLADVIPSFSLGNLFGFMLVPMGILLWVRGIRRMTWGVGDYSNSNVLTVETRRGRLIALGLGVFVGIMCGLFGAGGGGMILMILIFILHYPIHMAVGTASFIMMVTAISGTAGYVLHGNINIYAALIACIPTILAAGLGATIANRVNEKYLGRVIGAILIVLGIIMIATQYIV